jgi:hypothetical protein
MNILVVRAERRFLIAHPSTAWPFKEPALERFGPTCRSQKSGRHILAISERMVLDSLQEMSA